MKKVRVDFSAHISVVVAVKDCDDYLDKATEIADNAINEICLTKGVYWEADDGGANDADDADEIDIMEE